MINVNPPYLSFPPLSFPPLSGGGFLPGEGHSSRRGTFFCAARDILPGGGHSFARRAAPRAVPLLALNCGGECVVLCTCVSVCSVCSISMLCVFNLLCVFCVLTQSYSSIALRPAAETMETNLKTTADGISLWSLVLLCRVSLSL